jgi:hypothetical protein
MPLYYIRLVTKTFIIYSYKSLCDITTILTYFKVSSLLDGEWSSWESWGSCSVSCDGGIQSRLRTCSNPRPSLLGKYCDGSPDETRTCNKNQCAGILYSLLTKTVNKCWSEKIECRLFKM